MADQTSNPEAGKQTFGMTAVGASFNPSKNENVDKIKQTAADFIDSFHGLQDEASDGEVIAMYKLAQRAAQEAQMWAVKAVTWNL